ncbi:MAG: glycosyltransferase [Bacillota bacterium]|jgi:hypothetical protein
MWHLHKIPKLVHFYWGNDSLSFLRYLSVRTFQKFNPDWRIRFYYPKEKYRGERTWSTPEHPVKYQGPNYLEQLFALNIEPVELDFADLEVDSQIPETFKSDFLRWYLLTHMGGLWSDLDILYFRSIDELYLNAPASHTVDAVICLDENGWYNYHTIGFLLAAPGSRYYQFTLKESYACIDLSDYQSIGSSLLRLSFPTLAAIRSRFPELRVENLSLDVVYPLNDTQTPLIYHTGDLRYLTSRTIGLHWYAGHEASAPFENCLSETSYMNYQNIIAKLIRMVL